MWSVYNLFKDEFSENDNIFKLRNDISFLDSIEKLTQLEINFNTLYTPEKEFHAPRLFNDKIICNDQLWIMKKTTADKVFNLPYNYNEDQYFESQNKHPYHKSRNGGIELILRTYLYQENINLNTFSFNCKKV